MEFFFIVIFIAVQVERMAVVTAQTHVAAAVGGSVTVMCRFSFAGSWKIFCRDECQGDKLLVQTLSDATQNGRYGVRYDDASHNVMVSISQLATSDSGWYHCGLATPSSGYSLSAFHVSVTEGSIPSVWTPLRVQPSNSLSGGSRSLESPQVPTQSPEEGPVLKLTTAPSSGQNPSGVSLHVGVSLVVFTLVVSLLAAFLVYRGRTTGLKAEVKSCDANMEDVLYENCVSQRNYEDLDPSSREKNQDYSTLTD